MTEQEQDFGDEMVAYMAETLIALRDSLYLDGYLRAADLFADLTYRCDKYIEESQTSGLGSSYQEAGCHQSNQADRNADVHEKGESPPSS